MVTYDAATDVLPDMPYHEAVQEFEKVTDEIINLTHQRERLRALISEHENLYQSRKRKAEEAYNGQVLGHDVPTPDNMVEKARW